jgi:hypothetical protein
MQRIGNICRLGHYPSVTLAHYECLKEGRNKVTLGFAEAIINGKLQVQSFTSDSVFWEKYEREVYYVDSVRDSLSVVVSCLRLPND